MGKILTLAYISNKDDTPHSHKIIKKFFFSSYLSKIWQEMHVQGADDKLGQFLDQDIETSANHRNVLRHSMESCPSLVSFNENKPSIFIKICRQNTKLVKMS